MLPSQACSSALGLCKVPDQGKSKVNATCAAISKSKHMSLSALNRPCMPLQQVAILIHMKKSRVLKLAGPTVQHTSRESVSATICCHCQRPM